MNIARIMGNISSEFFNECNYLINQMLQPGSLLAFVQGDPCMTNILFRDTSSYLIDFEFSQMGHAFVDIACVRMMFPTCALANCVPLEIVREVELYYRRELIKFSSRFLDDAVFYTALVDACGYWLINTLGYHLEDALSKEEIWGVTSIRSRILSRLEAFINVSLEYKWLPNIRNICMHLLRELSALWLSSERLPLYPAFK